MKKKALALVFATALIIYLLTPVDINYPPTSNNSVDKYLSNYKIIENIFTHPYAFSSIAGNSVITNYNPLTLMNFSNKKIITTDMYNIAPYIKTDYILNDYLRPYYSYEKNDEIVSIYNNIPWINLEDLRSVIKNNKIILLADSRFKTNVNQETKDFIYENFNLVESTQTDYIGIIDGADKNNIEIFESK